MVIKGVVVYCGVSEYTLFYFGFNYVFFQIDRVCEQVVFANNNPSEWFSIFDKEKFTKSNLNLLFEKAKMFIIIEKKYRIQSKINEIEKDFIWT